MKNTAYINNQPYEYQDGETILNFVKRVVSEDIIPTLCDAPQSGCFWLV